MKLPTREEFINDIIFHKLGIDVNPISVKIYEIFSDYFRYDIYIPYKTIFINNIPIFYYEDKHFYMHICFDSISKIFHEINLDDNDNHIQMSSLIYQTYILNNQTILKNKHFLFSNVHHNRESIFY
jgi:hypothetical protein